MLYVFHGSDTRKARAKVRSVLDALFAKKPDAAFFHVDAEHWSRSQLQELAGGQGLFEQKYIVLLEHIFENEEAGAYLLDSLKEIAGAPHIFILQEGVLDKKTRTKVEKHAEKSQEFTEKAKQKKEFNIFALADACAARDTKKAWARLVEARGVSAPEEIHGVLFFQMKTLFLVKKCKSAREAGLNPFPYKKAKQHEQKFSEKELRLCLDRLVEVYHKGHRGEIDLDIGLEQFVLKYI